MATIGRDSGGRKRILFVAVDGKRKTIRLGKIPVKAAEEVMSKVESLNAVAINGVAVDGDTAGWLKKIGDKLHAKLATAGL
jgi:hypothetical protein